MGHFKDIRFLSEAQHIRAYLIAVHVCCWFIILRAGGE